MRFIITAATATLFALPALANGICDVPQDKWRPVEDLQTELTAKGWEVSYIKTEDGCYEVYAKDETGKRVELFLDPASFEVVGEGD